ncbi:MAG: hypothetical protein AAB590_00345, partial [Patescibacteria group bacterium]
YILERDSINFGGALGTSSNYSLEDTGGEVGTGRGTSTNYTLEAGYQQSDGYISITSPSDVTLLPAITTLSGGVADGNAVWTVRTDNPTGYSLYIKAANSPALTSSGSSFANYTKSGSVPDFSWSVPSNTSEFGFTPSGADIAGDFVDNGTVCGQGASDNSGTCWDAITTSNVLIARKSGSNHPTGIGTTVYFRAEAGSSASQLLGSYSALITLTAIAL